MNNEFEHIQHSNIGNLKIFLVSLVYRSPHIHSDLEICYVLDGEISVTSQRQTLTVATGDFYIINSYAVHELYSRDSALILAIQLSPKFCLSYFPQMKDMDFLFHSGNQYFTEDKQALCFSLAVTMAQHYFSGGEGFELCCMGLLNLFLYQLLLHFPYEHVSDEKRAAQYQKSRRVARITAFIDQHYTEKLLLSDIAEEESLSIPYLSHFFHDNFGQTFQEYLSAVRCEKARQLLLVTDHNLLSVSLESGFSDVKYMNQAFLKHYGCTAKDYRLGIAQKTLPDMQRSLLSTQTFLSQSASKNLLDVYIRQSGVTFTHIPWDMLL